MSVHLDDVQLSRMIDGDLSLTSREAVMTHLRSCHSCAERLERLIAVTAVLRLEPPLTWTGSDTESVIGRLPQRRHRVRAAVAALASAAMCAVVIFEVAPVIAATVALVGVLVDLRSSLAPPVATPGLQPLLVVAAVAVIAPLAAYPLARWR